MQQQDDVEGGRPPSCSDTIRECAKEALEYQEDISTDDRMRRILEPQAYQTLHSLVANCSWHEGLPDSRRPVAACDGAQQTHQDSGYVSEADTRVKTSSGGLKYFADAHQQPTSGLVRIPSCLLSGRPDLRGLIEEAFPGTFAADQNDPIDSARIHQVLSDSAQRSLPPRTKGHHDLEIEAIESVIAPVTKESLKELELPAIQNNLSLRIDLCFDHELFFQRISGLKGDEKQRKAKLFYECLLIELQAYAHALHGLCQTCKFEHSHGSCVQMPSRLGSFFEALRDLLGMLVPEADRDEVVQTVNAPWLVTQVRIGRFDAASFSSWLSKLLMTHCAPMRDEQARDMHQKISKGAELNNLKMVVDGLETLLNLLENMKLDVANHQVRSFKLLLIADTVPFLKDCFSKMIESHQIDFSRARHWFNKLDGLSQDSSETDFDVFLGALISLCCSGHDLPQTFAFDKERLQALQSDILDLVQLRICMRTHYELARAHGQSATSAKLRYVSARIMQLVHAEDGTRESVECHLRDIAMEIARTVTAISWDSKPSKQELTMLDTQYQVALRRLQERLEADHDDVVNHVLRQLVEQTTGHASRFRKMDTLGISNEQRTWSMTRSLKGSILAPDVDDISRRLAHVAVIHWEVWSELVYLDSS